MQHFEKRKRISWGGAFGVVVEVDVHVAVFIEPVGTQMQINPRGGDRTMPGLDLQRLDGHAALTQAGEARVAQLVTCPMNQTGASSRVGEHLVEAFGRERASLGASLQPGSYRCRYCRWSPGS